MGSSEMIDLETAKRMMDDCLTMRLTPRGFIRFAPLAFRRIGDVEQFLLFAVRKDARGYIALTASVALKFSAISELLAGSTPNGIHINIPVHLLSAERHYLEKQLTSIDQIPATAASFTGELESSALPFFVSFGTAVAMRDRLRSGNARDWFTLTPEQRIELLAALESALGNKSGAKQLINEALEQFRDALPKKRYGLERLRDKLVV